MYREIARRIVLSTDILIYFSYDSVAFLLGVSFQLHSASGLCSILDLISTETRSKRKLRHLLDWSNSQLTKKRWIRHTILLRKNKARGNIAKNSRNQCEGHGLIPQLLQPNIKAKGAHYYTHLVDKIYGALMEEVTKKQLMLLNF